jgi:hypothetical protein
LFVARGVPKPRSTDGLRVAERQDAPLNWEDRTC